MYSFLEFIHIFGAILFYLGHGATAIGMFNMRDERDPTALRALLGLRQTQVWTFGAGMFLMAVAGIWLGFLGNFWRTGWLWGSIVLFILISSLMAMWGRNYYDAIEMVLDPEGEKAKKAKKPETRGLEEILASGRVWLLTWIGILGTAAILYLMMYKPF